MSTPLQSQVAVDALVARLERLHSEIRAISFPPVGDPPIDPEELAVYNAKVYRADVQIRLLSEVSIAVREQHAAIVAQRRHAEALASGQDWGISTCCCAAAIR